MNVVRFVMCTKNEDVFDTGGADNFVTYLPLHYEPG
jgi:hypothetical protein